MTPQAYEDMARVQGTHWWYAARRRILRAQLQSLELPAGARILEVGSGTGANLAVLREFGEVTGLEMSARAITHAQRQSPPGQVTVVQGSFPEDIDRLTGRFDLVCLLDVLEHLPDDAHALQRLNDLLRPGGRILITVPAFAWLWGPHDTHHHHHRRYDRPQLRAACQRAGLCVVRMGHFNTVLFPLAVASRLLDRWRRHADAAVRVPPAPVNWLFERLFGVERFWTARAQLPVGLSIMAVVRPCAA